MQQQPTALQRLLEMHVDSNDADASSRVTPRSGVIVSASPAHLVRAEFIAATSLVDRMIVSVIEWHQK